MTSPSLPYRLRAARAALACALKTPHCRNVKKLVLAGHSNGARVAATLSTEMLLREEEREEEEEGQGKEAGGKARASAGGTNVTNDVKPIGCVFYSYPLHAPGKTSNLRDDELLSLRVPVLIIRGTRDAFSEEKVFDDLLRRLKTPFDVFEIRDGDHSLKVPVKKFSSSSSSSRDEVMIPTTEEARLAMRRLSVARIRHYVACGDVPRREGGKEEKKNKRIGGSGGGGGGGGGGSRKRERADGHVFVEKPAFDGSERGKRWRDCARQPDRPRTRDK